MKTAPKKYTLEEAMEVISKMREELGVKELHAKEEKKAYDRGYRQAITDLGELISKKAELLYNLHNL
jgi:hypothetical protein